MIPKSIVVNRKKYFVHTGEPQRFKRANGYIEYRQSLGPTAGRLYARLARLSIAATT